MEAIHLFNTVDSIVAARIAAAYNIDPTTMYIEVGLAALVAGYAQYRTTSSVDSNTF